MAGRCEGTLRARGGAGGVDPTTSSAFDTWIHPVKLGEIEEGRDGPEQVCQKCFTGPTYTV